MFYIYIYRLVYRCQVNCCLNNSSHSIIKRLPTVRVLLLYMNGTSFSVSSHLFSFHYMYPLIFIFFNFFIFPFFPISKVDIYTSTIHTYSFSIYSQHQKTQKKKKKQKKGLLCSHVSSFFLWYFLISCFYVALQAWRGRRNSTNIFFFLFLFSWWLHIMILNEVYELILIWIEECKKKIEFFVYTNIELFCDSMKMFVLRVALLYSVE